MVRLTINVTYRNLKYLYASALNPTSMKNIDFKYLPSLVELDLSYNNLTNLISFFQYRNTNLKKLYLQGSILDYSLNFLSNFTNLVELDLSSTLSVKWLNQTPQFNKLNKLEVFILRNLNMGSALVEKLMFQLHQIKVLSYLDLSGNNIEYFNTSLSFMINLRYLSLANNSLRLLNFNLLPLFLNMLDFSFNNLSTFRNYVSIKFLKAFLLNNNNLAELTTNIQSLVQTAYNLDLSFNKFQLC
jgi:Leucine-rich repeat (LRR) protein